MINASMKHHAVLGVVLVGLGLIGVLHPHFIPAVGLATGGLIVLHVGGLLLAGTSWAWWRARHPQAPISGDGVTIRWARGYDWLISLLMFGREQQVRQAILEIAGISPGERLVDVGCGTGTMALAAKARVGETGVVQGVDASEEMVARAKEKCARAGLDVAFDVASAQRLPFEDGRFDVAVGSLMLHHLTAEGRRQALEEMKRVLKPGGRLLIVEIGHAHGWAAFNPVYHHHGHEVSRIVDETATLMKELGLHDLASGPVKFSPLRYLIARI
jgi:ubiquinone/menaquinone biosynthesis C-methylase UbiE